MLHQDISYGVIMVCYLHLGSFVIQQIATDIAELLFLVLTELGRGQSLHWVHMAHEHLDLSAYGQDSLAEGLHGVLWVQTYVLIDLGEGHEWVDCLDDYHPSTGQVTVH